MEPALAAERESKARLGAIHEAMSRGDSDITRFYDGATIFVTGGSGFLGKHLIEKLIRSCNVSKIYVLLRAKGHKPAPTRLQDILSDPVYDRLREMRPNFDRKIIPVVGDVSELNIGMSEQDRKLINEEVHIIFHVAATTNFNENMRFAIFTNVRGTREVLRLARSCKRLRSIVHVSTAFAHATKSRIKKTVAEDFYEVPAMLEELIRLAENNETERLNEIFEIHGAEWPNTYTFTKAFAEETVKEMAAGIPICIVRPSVVIAAFREPAPGWVDGNQVIGSSGVMLGAMTGIIHIILADSNNRLDVVPVDVVSNALIAAGWESGVTNERADGRLKIYTVSNTRKPLLIRDISRNLQTHISALVTPNTKWYCFTTTTKFKLIYLMMQWFLYYIPAFIADNTLFLICKKPRLLKLFKKVNTLSSVLSHFMVNEWTFEDINTLRLYNSLSATDKDLFNFDIGLIDGSQLVATWCLGIRRYIIKDGLQDTEYGRKKQSLLKIVHYTVLTVYIYAMFKFCCWISSFFVLVFSVIWF